VFNTKCAGEAAQLDDPLPSWTRASASPASSFECEDSDHLGARDSAWKARPALGARHWAPGSDERSAL